MSPIVASVLAVLAAAPSALAEVQALWAGVKSAASASDQATVDGILAMLNPKVDTDIAALHAAALAGAAT